MAEVLIRGGRKLNGSIKVQGSKNSILPMIVATILCRDITIIENCPIIEDVRSMLQIFQDIGGKFELNAHQLILDTRTIYNIPLKQKETEKLRASILCLGALLGRNKSVAIGYPGGCSIGKRPIDYHLNGFRALGAVIEEGTLLKCSGTLCGAEYTLPYPSVGATENLLLAAVTAKGTTILHNAAQEPEIVDFIDFLKQMGAKITGRDCLRIEGVETLHGIHYCLPYDRIAAGTYLFTVVGTGGTICLEHLKKDGRLANILPVIEQMGGTISFDSKGLWLNMKGKPRRNSLVTGTHPAFPTDLQSIAMATMLKGKEEVTIRETVFENRFLTAREFQKMGAKLLLSEKEVVLQKTEKLHGAKVCAKDLRGGAALILAALTAEGESIMTGSEYMERGYETLVKHLKQLGADCEYPSSLLKIAE